jgi:hypothetical protein
MPVATKKPGQAAPAPRASYEGDFYTWTQEQGSLLRARRFDGIDWENVAEEIETLGRDEFRKLVSFYRLILLHMLKFDHQPNNRTRSWLISIDNHRDSAAEVLADNPGLKSRVDEAVARAYSYARRDAADETGLPLKAFAPACPYSIDEIRDRPFPFE